MQRLASIREWLTILIVTLLPLHAFFVTVSTKLILGAGHAPLSWIALWKEALVATILLLSFIEWTCNKGWKVFRFDRIDCIILFGCCFSLFLLIGLGRPLSVSHFLLGFKYDFVPLFIFFVLRRVSWSSRFSSIAATTLLTVGAGTAFYGILSAFLPMSFFTIIGYSDLHSLYQPNAPLAAFQQIGGSTLRRIQSTMSGPNQFGLWLLIPIGILLTQMTRNNEKRTVKNFFLGGVFMFALFLTFSRAAWASAFCMIVVAFWSLTILKKQTKIRWTLGFGFFVVTCGIAFAFLFPSLLFRIHSSSDHIKKPVEAMRTMLVHPLGLGLGTAGPASNRVSDTCVMLAAGADASWAQEHSNLCVFVGGEKMQPKGRDCQCPLLTENWYLQWAVEMGFVGLLVSVMLAFFVVISGKRLAASGERGVSLLTTHYSLLTFLGISIAGLFLHSFEDAAVAYTVWILLATVL